MLGGIRGTAGVQAAGNAGATATFGQRAACQTTRGLRPRHAVRVRVVRHPKRVSAVRVAKGAFSGPGSRRWRVARATSHGEGLPS